MNMSTPIISLMSFMLVACGGNSNNDEEKPVSIVVDDSPLVRGGSGMSCLPGGESSFKTGNADKLARVDKLCVLAKMAYMEADSLDESPTVYFTTDFKDTGTDYLEGYPKPNGTLYDGTQIHTGIDMQGAGELKGSKIASITNGVVEYVNQAKGYVVIRFQVSNGDYRALGYMHMTDIQVYEGDEVSVGKYIGTSSNVGTKSIHLHLDAINCNFAYAVPNFEPSSVYTWGNGTKEGLVIEPTSLIDEIVSGNTKIPTESERKVTVCVPELIESDIANRLSGSVKAGTNIKFSILDQDQNIILEESYKPQKVENGREDVYGYGYNFGQESALGSTASGNYIMQVSASVDGSIYTTSHPFYFNQNTPADTIDLNFSNSEYTYLNGGQYIEGCIISEKDLKEVEVQIKDPELVLYKQTWTAEYIRDSLNGHDYCNGADGINIDELGFRGKNSNDERLDFDYEGAYEGTIIVRFEDDSEITMEKDEFLVKNQIDYVETTYTGGSSLYVYVHYVRDESEITVPYMGCTRFEIPGYEAGGGGATQPDQSDDFNQLYDGHYINRSFYDEENSRYITSGSYYYEIRTCEDDYRVLNSGTVGIIQD